MIARIVIVLTAMLIPATAMAFHEVSSFDRTANSGGGAGYYYSGSARSKGYDCTFCHVDTEGKISVEVFTELASGTYEPGGDAYQIDVTLIGEHKGLDSAFNPNTFTAEMIDDQGQPVGQFAAIPRGIVKLPDDAQVAVAEGFGNGETEWQFFWVPPDDATPATFHLALLDGDGASDPVVRFIDPLNDDVVTVSFRLCPTGQTCQPPMPRQDTKSVVDCASGPGGASTWLMLLAVMALYVRRSKPERVADH